MTPFLARARAVSRVSDLGERPEPARPTTLRELGVPDHGEAVAADAGAGGLEEAEAGVGGDRRVDGRAAALQDFDGGQGGEGCAVPAAPEQPMAAERVAKLAPETRSPA